MKPKAIIFDIDGTLAIRDTGPDGRGPFDWDRVGEDTVNEPVMLVAKMLAFTATATRNVNTPDDRTDILLFSGRDERARYPTELWLDEHFGFDYKLYMRLEKDNRSDHEVKKEMMAATMVFWDIVAVFDDRNQVVDMWRGNGITCMQVCSREQGDF